MAHFPSSTSLVLTNYLVSYTGCVLSLPFDRWRHWGSEGMCSTVKGTWADTRGFESQLCCWVSLTCLLSLSPFVYKMRVETPALQERMKWKGRWKVSGTSWAINAQAMIFVVIVIKVTCQGHRGKIECTSSNHKSSARSGYHLPLNHMPKLTREDFELVSMWGCCCWVSRRLPCCESKGDTGPDWTNFKNNITYRGEWPSACGPLGLGDLSHVD